MIVAGKGHLRELAFPLLIAGVGLGLRLWGSQQGYPNFYGHVDEVGVAASIWNFFRAGTLLPTEFTYPALYSYLVAALIWLSGWFSGLPDIGSNHDALVLLSYLDPARAAILGRGLSAVAGAATVLVAFLLGRRAFGRQVGLMAAAFMACAIVPVIQSHKALPDSAMALFAALCLLASWRVFERGSWGDYLGAGAAAGLMLASKYNGAFTALAIPAAHLVRARCRRLDALPSENRRGGLVPRDLLSLRLWGAVAVAVAALFIGSPYLFLASDRYLHVASYQVSSLGFTMGEVRPWWWVVEQLVLRELALGGLMLAAVMVALVRRRPFDCILLAVWLPSFAYIGSWTRESLHYLIHLYPILAVAAATVVAELAQRVRHRGGRRLLLVACLAPNLAAAVSHSRNLDRPDTRSVASEWIEENVAAGSKIAMTWLPYCPRLALLSERRSIWAYYEASAAAREILRESWKIQPAYRLVNLETWAKSPQVPPSLLGVVDLDDPETARIFRRGWRSPDQLAAAGVEYVILPEAVYGRYLTGEGPNSDSANRNAAAYHFERNRDYFLNLTDAETALPVAEFPAGAESRGSTIRVFRLLQNRQAGERSSY